jgi:hypothetical protein
MRALLFVILSTSFAFHHAQASTPSSSSSSTISSNNNNNNNNNHPAPQVQAALLLTEGRSGSTFVGEILNQDQRVLYFYEPCRTLNWGDGSGAGPMVASARLQCEQLVVRLLSCNATESDLRMLLKDWRAVKHDALLLKLAGASGVLKGYDPQKPNVPGTLMKAGPARGGAGGGVEGGSSSGGGGTAGKLGAAFAGKCPTSWRVVKELAHRFDSPIPRSVLHSVREHRQALVRSFAAAKSSSSSSSGKGSGNSGPLAGLSPDDDDDDADVDANSKDTDAEKKKKRKQAAKDKSAADASTAALCASAPNHWACTGVDALKLQQQLQLEQQQQLTSGESVVSTAVQPPIKVCVCVFFFFFLRLFVAVFQH